MFKNRIRGNESGNFFPDYRKRLTNFILSHIISLVIKGCDGDSRTEQHSFAESRVFGESLTRVICQNITPELRPEPFQ